MATAARRRYRTGLTDSARWDAIVLRDDDIVISTPSKCGTTWMQMICALLVFQDAPLPAPLTALSPWVDMRLRPIGEVVAQIEAQRHRRFLKTHTPLDGLPWREGVRYVVVGRDPRDVAVSMTHHRANLNGAVIEGANRTMDGWPGFAERLRGWIEDDRPPEVNLSSLTGTLWHLAGAWRRRDDESVILAHYDDLLADLQGQMRRIAAALSIDVHADRWSALASTGSFDAMRAGSAAHAPDEGMGLLLDPDAFFRAGRSGQWREAFTAEDLRRYDVRLASLAPPDLVRWLHR